MIKRMIFAVICMTGLLACSHHNAPYLGYIEAYLVYTAPAVSGHIQTLNVVRGQPIKAGQILYQLDPEPEQSYLDQSKYTLAAEEETLADLEKGQRDTILEGIRANLSEAQVQQSLAKITLDRNKALYQKYAVSKAALDTAQTDYDARSQEVKQLEASLAEATLGAREHLIQAQSQKVKATESLMNVYAWQLSQKTGTAAESGIVFDTLFRTREFVNAGQAVLSILSPKEIRVLFYIPELDYSRIKLGQTVWFEVDGQKKAQAVKISFVSKDAEYTPPVIYSSESKTKLVYRIEARIPENLALTFHPGSPVRVYLQAPE